MSERERGERADREGGEREREKRRKEGRAGEGKEILSRNLGQMIYSCGTLVVFNLH